MIAPPAIADRDLQAVIDLVYERSGIALHAGKRALVTARLQKLVRAGGFATFADYLAGVKRDRSGEALDALLDAITTNHTSFFREPQHFEFLVSRVAALRGGIDVWSAGCATGEEPYSLAMALADARPDLAERGDVRILASDLSGSALARARAGVYPIDRVRDVPDEARRRHLEKGLGAQAGLARVRPHLRRMVRFERLNLLDIDHLGRAFDVIFCRNVMIYFDQRVQQRVVGMLERHLAPGGYLFVAHAESLTGLAHGLRAVAPAVYTRRPA
ncbi:MAG: protein-glutamate O-methyltransferase CheR [Acidobacteriota bacterium]